MNRRIGFDRSPKLDWLDSTVALYQDDPDPRVIAQHLDSKLAGDIAGQEARRKTIIVLLRIWVRVPPGHRALRDEALELVTRVASEDRLWLHWGLSLLAYPFFRDVAAIVGQLGRLQGAFNQAQVRRRMVEDWGQRTTLERAVQRLLRTFIEWQVLTETGVRGQYSVPPARSTEDLDLALWLFDCALRAHDADHVPLGELASLPFTFPFELASFAHNIRHSARFEVTRQGLDLEMVGLGAYPLASENSHNLKFEQLGFEES